MPKINLGGLETSSVLGDITSAGIIKASKIMPLVKMDKTLMGVPGDQLKRVKFSYIGDAEIVGMAEPITDAKLLSDSTLVDIKKIANRVDIADEQKLSAEGNIEDEVTSQLSKSIARRIDTELLAEMEKAKLTLNRSTVELSAAVVADVDVLFGEDQSKGVIFVAPAQFAQLRKDPSYINPGDMGDDILYKGNMGSVFGHEIVLSNRITPVEGVYTNYLLKKDALALLLKRDILLEVARNTITCVDTYTVNQIFGVYIYDDSKVARFTTKDSAYVAG